MRRRQQPDRKPWLILVLVLGGLLVLCVAVPLLGVILSRSDGSPAQVDVQTRTNATLTLAHSPEKSALVRSLVDKFNARNLRTADREAMRVELIEMTPEEMVAQALAGPSFQALSPDSSLWLDQLELRWSQSQNLQAGQIPARLVGDPVRYAITPIVIAAWEGTARQLGWPDKPVGWTSLQERARQDANFKWSHPSTAHASGLLATLAEFYAAAGVQRGLTEQMAQDPKTIETVSAIEKTVRYYGEGELPVAQRAAKEGNAYLDAFVVSEQLVVAINAGTFGKAPAKLVALYPAEGTLWADHPLALLESQELTANQRATFQALRQFLVERDTQTEVLRAGYRPADLNVPLTGTGSPISSANGVDPAQPQTTLQMPSSTVVSVVQSAWQLAKRKTNVILVVDTSGSMQGEKLTNAQSALRTFLGAIPSEQERVGMISFNTRIDNVIELDTLAKNRVRLSDEVDSLRAGGDTALLDGVRAAYNRLQANGDPDRINAIVAMTDGKENASTITLRALANEIREGNKKVPVVIFAIAYGRDADYTVMQTLADASGGQVRAGTLETIRDLYKVLSSYF